MPHHVAPPRVAENRLSSSPHNVAITGRKKGFRNTAASQESKPGRGDVCRTVSKSRCQTKGSIKFNMDYLLIS